MQGQAKHLDERPAHERYAFKPFRGSSHFWAFQCLKGHCRNQSVLDVGAGGGGMGALLRKEAPHRLIAVEIDKRSHAVLEKTYDSVHSDISEIFGEQFEWILLLDVLEHLPRPDLFLKTLSSMLAPGGRMIISVPNVAHWSVRFPLFFAGRFEYRPLGILDRTHLQFFTRKTFYELLDSLQNFRVERSGASIEPLEFALPPWFSATTLYRATIPPRLWLARSFPGLMAYQHLAVIRAAE